MINEIVTDKDSNVLMFYDYVYGNAGERTKSIEVVRNSVEDENCKVICNRYEYDKLLRLTKEVISIAENVKFSDVINTDVTADNVNITDIIDNINIKEFSGYTGCIINTYSQPLIMNMMKMEIF